MNELPSKKVAMPSGLTLKRSATNLASLAMSDALLSVAETLVLQWRSLPLFAPLARYGIQPLNRALFYGPPGNGKTVASQVIAHRLGCPLYRVCCEQLITSRLGSTTEAVGDVMSWVALQPTCVVLWDEVECIFPSREAAGTTDCAREMGNAMSVFWQRLDRWNTPQLFLLATNLIERLDPALRSRIDLQLEFGPPTEQQANDVLGYWSETLHEHGSEQWAPTIADGIRDGSLLVSFRALWQSIASETRNHVLRNM